MSDTDWTIIAGLAMLIGLITTFVPVVPGLVVIWVSALIYGFAVGFGTIGIVSMFVLTGLVIASVLFSLIVPKKMSEDHGSSRAAQWGGLVGAVIGFFVIPVVGLIIGALIGVMAVELSVHKDWGVAWTSTKGLAKGFGVSALIDIGLGTAMVVVWAFWALTVLS